MKLTAENKFINPGFFIALLILFLLSIFTYRLFKINEDDERMVKHTYQVLQNSKELFSSLKDAETGQRGYIITGNEKFLEPFYISLSNIDNLQIDLKLLTADNESQQKRITEIKFLTSHKIYELRKNIDLRRNNEINAAIANIKTGKGKNMMDKIRLLFDQVDNEENALLVGREKRSNNTTSNTKLFLLGGMIISMSILIFTYVVLQKQITRRKKNEIALHESREWFAKTLFSIGDGVITTDENFSITFINPVAEKLTGWSSENAKGKPIDYVFKIINEFSRLKVESPVMSAITEKRIVELANHTILIRKDKSEICINDSASPIVDQAGNVAGAVLVFRDVTEQKRIQKEISASNKKFTEMFNLSPVAITIASVNNGKFMYANEAFCNSMGYKKEEIIGRSPLEIGFIGAEEREKVRSKLQTSGNMRSTEVILQRSSGEKMHVMSSIEQMEVDGEMCFLTSFIDVTEEKIVEEKLKLLYNELENKNNDILDSIYYAKNIQNAFLPDKSNIKHLLPDSFIYHKPKNIISGDFYWLKEDGDVILLAVADCTGHGVPGALMSMIGSQKLNEVVSKNDNLSQVLNDLNKEIKTSLQQSENHTSMRDGMDIALCSINKKTCVVKYVGANRPFWIIRKDEQILEEIKATKKAIGGYTEDSQFFMTHELQLKKGDTFYIFSDGYVDQFGGEKGKKLKTKKFKEILVGIQGKTMNDQKQFLHSFVEDWKAETEQVDDILVLGVRL